MGLASCCAESAAMRDLISGLLVVEVAVDVDSRWLEVPLSRTDVEREVGPDFMPSCSAGVTGFCSVSFDGSRCIPGRPRRPIAG